MDNFAYGEMVKRKCNICGGTKVCIERTKQHHPEYGVYYVNYMRCPNTESHKAILAKKNKVEQLTLGV